jgi:hypothetical protein
MDAVAADEEEGPAAAAAPRKWGAASGDTRVSAARTKGRAGGNKAIRQQKGEARTRPGRAPIDFSNYRHRHVAFKLMYHGEEYCGLAAQVCSVFVLCYCSILER